jgi:ribonucleoside-diphosphate reductase alpha chain
VISTGRTSTYTTVVNITNEFLQAVENDADWRLIDPKTKEAVKTVNARDLWWQIINARAETG